MANPIPQKIREEVYDRATPITSTYPACEITGNTKDLQIHHITGRHSHHPINLILLTEEKHRNIYENSLYKQLKLGMRDMLSRWYLEEEVRKKMGGKIPTGKLKDNRVRRHFHKVEKRYRNELMQNQRS